MRQVTTYTYNLTTSNELQLSVGPRQLNLQFKWPVAYQEQADIFNRHIAEYSSADPLVVKNGTDITYDRDYDYIDYYLNIPAYGDGMEEWLDTSPDLPQSLQGKEASSLYTLLTERKEQAEEYATYRTNLGRVLQWYVQITDDLGDIRTGIIHPGGWINNQDSNWALRFTADIDTISQDNIDKVTLEIEVYEFV